MAMKEPTAAIEGVVSGAVSYHYDAESDVLYVRLIDHMNTEAYGDENEDGIIVLRSLDDDSVIGLTLPWYALNCQQSGRKHPGDIEFPAAVASLAERYLPLVSASEGPGRP